MKLYDDIVGVYDYMYTHAQGDTFTGSTTAVYREVAGNMANYSKAFRLLSEMGCTEQLQRGKLNVDSVIRLIREPCYEDFTETYAKPDLTKRVTLAKLQQDLETLERRMPITDLIPLLESIDTRLTELEAAVQRTVIPREE